MKAMKVDAIRVYCLDFPEAKENLQWGDELCFKVGGKMVRLVSYPSQIALEASKQFNVVIANILGAISQVFRA